jgi:NhaA family Na+:H+ antiporter
VLLALLAAIGFTMSIFIATLAFGESPALDVAKRAVLLASGTAAFVALALGWLLFRRRRPPHLPSTDSASSRLPG